MNSAVPKGDDGQMELESLARRAKEGDKEAFVSLMESCKPSLLGVARSILRNEEDVADAMQDTVLKAFRSIGGLKKPGNCKTWLTRILINSCYEVLRGKKTVPLEEFLPENAALFQKDPAGQWDASLDVRKTLDELVPGDRLILTLFYVEDFSQKQIGQALDITENAVKQRLARAKRHFKSAYEKGAAVNE